MSKVATILNAILHWEKITYTTSSLGHIFHDHDLVRLTKIINSKNISLFCHFFLEKKIIIILQHVSVIFYYCFGLFSVHTGTKFIKCQGPRQRNMYNHRELSNEPPLDVPPQSKIKWRECLKWALVGKLLIKKTYKFPFHCRLRCHLRRSVPMCVNISAARKFSGKNISIKNASVWFLARLACKELF